MGPDYGFNQRLDNKLKVKSSLPAVQEFLGKSMHNDLDNLAAADLDTLKSIFQSLADKTRLALLLQLLEGEQSVGSLCDTLKLPQPSVSHHLGLLKKAEVVIGRRQSKQIFYRLSKKIAVAEEAFRIDSGNHTISVRRRIE